jgi:hypothetical protein
MTRAGSLTVAETIIEISKTHSPTGHRFIPKPYPKDNEPRTFGVRQDWLDAIAEHITTEQIGRDADQRNLDALNRITQRRE